MTGRAMPGLAHQDQPETRYRPPPQDPLRNSQRGTWKLARLLDRFALLRGQGGIEPYEPRRVGLVELSDALSGLYEV